MNNMEKILDHIHRLESNSSENLNEDQKLGYLTACLSIEQFVKALMDKKMRYEEEKRYDYRNNTRPL